MKGKTTLADVAKVAGVSITTVSFVLGGRHTGIPQATADKVWKAASSLSYAKPSGARLKGWLRVACLCESLDRFTAEFSFFAAACERLQRLGVKYRLQLFHSEFPSLEDTAACERKVQELQGLGIDAVVSERCETVEYLVKRGFKAVLVQAGVMPDCICIHSDDRETGRLAAAHALANGHRQAGFIAPPDMEAHPRFKGFRETFETGGGVCQERFLWTVPWEHTRSAERIAHLVEGRKRIPSVFLCHSDTLALSAMRGFAKAGLKVPDDISLIGVGNLPWSDQTTPALTSVSLLPDIFVRRLVDAVRDAASGEAPYSIASPVRLVARETVRRIE